MRTQHKIIDEYIKTFPEDVQIILGKNKAASEATEEMPVMIVADDADAICPAHTVEFFDLHGGGKRDAGLIGPECLVQGSLSCLPPLITIFWALLYCNE